MKNNLIAFLSGLVFAAGLGLSGMTQPAKVLAFLDVGGAWDPSLAFVMVGAIAVHAVAWRIARRRGIVIEVPKAIDARLVGGAALFGIGWGLSGWCPGPAFVAVGSGLESAWVFALAMFWGHALVARVDLASADEVRVVALPEPARAK